MISGQVRLHEYTADSVVIAAGMKSDDNLATELEGKIASLYKIGTCARPGKVVDAIFDGFQTGFTV